jgi:tetratricopeptide (TPR) repeat protein
VFVVAGSCPTAVTKTRRHGVWLPAWTTLFLAAILWTIPPLSAFAATTEPAKDPQIDTAPCLAAVTANDDDQIVAVCAALVDSDRTQKADRLKALLARAGAYGRKDQIDRAIGDYDAALRLDSTLADIFNARGELWRRKGDRPRALADFGAALKLNSQHEAARANYKSLALELERLGAQMAIKNRPNPPLK